MPRWFEYTARCSSCGLTWWGTELAENEGDALDLADDDCPRCVGGNVVVEDLHSVMALGHGTDPGVPA